MLNVKALMFPLLPGSREVDFSLEAAEELAKEGINVEVLDLRTLVPLDWMPL